MKPRFRVLAALLALLAFSASLAEQVWACAPMDASAAAHHAAMRMPAGDAAAPMAMHHASPGHRAPANRPDRPAECPLAAASSCTVPAVPAAAPRIELAPSPTLAPLPPPCGVPGRLAVASLFRPPIA